MKGLLIAAFLLLSSASAMGGHYYVSPSGNDANTCSISSPCKTFNSVIDRLPDGSNAIHPAPGYYPEVVNIYYNIQISISGTEGTCTEPQNVVVDKFWVQDGAIAWIECLTTQSIQSRQYSIVDVANVIFNGSGPSEPVPLVAVEDSTINCGQNLWVTGTFQVFMVGGPGAHFKLFCNIVLPVGISASHFLQTFDAIVELNYATFSGSNISSGQRWYCDGGSIWFPTSGGAAAIPGSGSTSINSCKAR